MEHNFNEEIKNELADAIINGLWDDFASLRNREGDPGNTLYLENLDLSGRELGLLPTNFLCFKKCTLDNSSFAGKNVFPVSLWSCKAQNIDLRNTSGMLFAFDTDLRGAKFDKNTQLVVDNSELPSAFKNCLMDDNFKEFLVAQGVYFDFPNESYIEQYAFGVTKEMMKAV